MSVVELPSGASPPSGDGSSSRPPPSCAGAPFSAGSLPSEGGTTTRPALASLASVLPPLRSTPTSAAGTMTTMSTSTTAATPPSPVSSPSNRSAAGWAGRWKFPGDVSAAAARELAVAARNTTLSATATLASLTSQSAGRLPLCLLASWVATCLGLLAGLQLTLILLLPAAILIFQRPWHSWWRAPEVPPDGNLLPAEFEDEFVRSADKTVIHFVDNRRAGSRPLIFIRGRCHRQTHKRLSRDGGRQLRHGGEGGLASVASPLPSRRTHGAKLGKA
eukprot:GHVT01013612.1.p1 GENE.GHVT01013612.1~~GHVT01013612.1.p1  ORF type:complete len:276 (+),score=68.12 GHVT01013612.1:763-1590(+)